MTITARQLPMRSRVDCDDKLSNMLADLEPISLAQCNARASMQDRIDTKYLVDLEQIEAFLEAIRAGYTVLQIEDLRQFRYRSCYYDDRFSCYLEHHQGRRQRLKVRTREYVDGGGQKYFEIKLKGSRGRTVKHRCEASHLIMPRIEGAQLQMLQNLYAKQYAKVMRFDLRPALLVGYTRCTLVATDGSERITIDSHLNFRNMEPGASAVEIGSDFIIIETKSSNGKGTADAALKNLHIRQVAKCSKYCIGANLTNSVRKNNAFLPTVRRAQRNLRIKQTCEN